MKEMLSLMMPAMETRPLALQYTPTETFNNAK